MTVPTINPTKTGTDLDYGSYVDHVSNALHELFVRRRHTIRALVTVENDGRPVCGYDDYLAVIADKVGDKGELKSPCRRCRDLIDLLGPVIVLYNDGTQASLLWQTIEGNAYQGVAEELNRRLIENHDGKVTPFCVNQKDVLTLHKSRKKETGGFPHFHVTRETKTYIAEKFPKSEILELNEQVNKNFEIGFYRDGAKWLYNADKVLGNRMSLPSYAKDQIKKNIGFYEHMFFSDDYPKDIRKAFAVSAGLLHLKQKGLKTGNVKLNSTVIGNLIERAQKSPEAAIHHYLEETDPTRYLRSDKASVEKTIEAENYFRENGLTKSLNLRVATLEEIDRDLDHLWRETGSTSTEEEHGLFSGVVESLSKDKKESALPPLDLKDYRKVTFTQFLEEILPTLTSLNLKHTTHAATGFITTMEHKEAPCVFKWSTEERPMPYAWMFINHYNGFKANTINVSHVINDPCTQVLGRAHKHEQVMFIVNVENNTNLSQVTIDNPLFPEILRDDLFQYRKTVEAFNKLDENQIRFYPTHVMFSLSEEIVNQPNFSASFSGRDKDGEEVGVKIVMW